MARPGLRWPIDPATAPVTQGFGGDYPAEAPGWLERDRLGPRRARRSKLEGAEYRTDLHGGIDQAAPIGTPIVAPEAGTIVAAGTYASTGEHYLMLEIRPGVVVFMTHLKAGGLVVPVGRHVTRGQRIAHSGNSGMSTGPHLHWEVRRTTGQAWAQGSSSWIKWNPRRLVVGGDLAELPWLAPR